MGLPKGSHLKGRAPPVSILVVVVIENEGAARLDQDGFDVVPFKRDQGGITLQDVAQLVAAVAAVVKESTDV
jgi:hypothetical protein